LALFLSGEGLSKVRRLDYAKVKEKKSNFQNVCKIMKGQDVLLARSHDLVNVDCMGEVFPVTAFCEKEFKEVDYLVRGFTDKDTQKAYCIFSSQAILKWECPTKGLFNCEVQAKTECQNLKPIYATSLDVFKAYYSEEGPDKILNCIYNGAKITKLLK
jgi:hypothetical protein